MNEHTHDTPSYKTAVVFGASGAIGQAFCEHLLNQGCQKLIRIARSVNQLPSYESLALKHAVEIQDIAFDLTDESTIENAVKQLPDEVDLVVIATGWLHDHLPHNNSDTNEALSSDGKKHFEPEKTFKSLEVDHLSKSWKINFLGPSLILKALLLHLPHRKHKTMFAILSARVGSISDNRMGGWYSYRSSKAALNMMIKNLSIELKRLRSKSLLVALQPGTTDSQLSKPFQKFIKPEQLQTPDFTAEHLLRVLPTLTLENSGELIDFEGNIITP